MDRRYQVFISSTFTDLTEERAAVATAIQQCNHIPAGMELFPSGNNPPWDVIERVISTSDYYAVIVGGRYGSLAEDGLSWTEKEYELAISLSIPVLPFIHADRKALIRSADVDAKSHESLANFISRLSRTHTVKEWRDSGDLASKVLVALIYEFVQNPRPGWVRGDAALEREEILQTLESVRAENDQLKTYFSS